MILINLYFLVADAHVSLNTLVLNLLRCKGILHELPDRLPEHVLHGDPEVKFLSIWF